MQNEGRGDGEEGSQEAAANLFVWVCLKSPGFGASNAGLTSMADHVEASRQPLRLQDRPDQRFQYSCKANI